MIFPKEVRDVEKENTSFGKKVTVIMPSLFPNEKTLHVITRLREEGFDDILLIDDGGCADSPDFFERAAACGCEVLHHGKCCGRGAALRTGFRYFLNTRRDRLGVVTVDSDGQHRAEDAAKCARLMLEKGNSLVIGRRDLSDRSIARHSRYSGRVTSLMMLLFCGLRLKDPQSGLRAIPRQYLDFFCGIGGDRYDYEIHILLECKSRSIPVCETDIRADYSDADRTSYYRSVRDSVRINSMFLKFSLSSMSGYLVDVTCFWLFAHFFNGLGGTAAVVSVPVSTVLARVVSTILCYLFNRNGVFRTREKSREQAGKYAVCVAGIMTVSALSTWLLTTLLHVGVAWKQTLLKCCIDTVLFFVNFRIQHEWVFARKD